MKRDPSLRALLAQAARERLGANRSNGVFVYDAASEFPTEDEVRAFRRRNRLGADDRIVLIPDNGRDRRPT